MPDFRQGITQTDIMTLRRIFQANGDPEPRIFWRYKPADDTWEAYYLAGALPARVAARDENGEWVED